MFLKYHNKIISGILSILPNNEILFDDEIDNYSFPENKTVKLKKIMGYNKRRIVKNGTTSSDLCIKGLEYLFANKLLCKTEIDALILVTQTPDYLIPSTSNVIQGHFNLKEDVFCMDINQGCSGYIVGLIQSFMLLDQDAISKVVLLNADTLSQNVSKHDRNSNPLIGDGASITIVESTTIKNEINCSIKMDGGGAFALNIPAGGSRLPYSKKTGILKKDESGNIRSKNHLIMKGDLVFNFVQSKVPEMIDLILNKSSFSKEEIDFYMFHQPNKFMLSKLAEKIGIPKIKMPNNIVENFGNSSGATIPIAISHNLGDRLCKESFKLCLAGFGVGLSWGSIVIEIGNLKFNKIIYE